MFSLFAGRNRVRELHGDAELLGMGFAWKH